MWAELLKPGSRWQCRAHSAHGFCFMVRLGADRVRVDDKLPGTDFRQLSDRSRCLFLSFARAHVSAPVTYFISLEVGNLIDTL